MPDVYAVHMCKHPASQSVAAILSVEKIPGRYICPEPEAEPSLSCRKRSEANPKLIPSTCTLAFEHSIEYNSKHVR